MASDVFPVPPIQMLPTQIVLIFELENLGFDFTLEIKLKIIEKGNRK